MNRDRRFWLLLAGMVSGLLMVIVVNERVRVEVADALRWRRHTLQVQIALQTVLVTVLDAETGQRGFLLSGDPAYRAPYERARQSLSVSLDTVRSLTAAAPSQQQRLARLDAAIAEKMRELQATVEEFAEGNPAAAMELVRTNSGQAAMDRIRALIGEGLEEEQAQLAARDLEVRGALRRAALFTYVILGIVVVTLAVTIYLRQRLRRLEPLLTLCAWSKTVRLGDEWVTFEEYLQRRFGISVTHGISPHELARFDAGPAE